MKKPKYRIDKYIRFKDKSRTKTEVVYILKEQIFWIFYSEIFRSTKKSSVDRLLYQINKKHGKLEGSTGTGIQPS